MSGVWTMQAGCPQHLEIINYLKDVSKMYGKAGLEHEHS